MVNRLMLMSMLHCKRMMDEKIKIGDSASEGPLQEEITENADVKTEVNKFSICRVCLKDGNIPIYGTDKDISVAVITFGAIEMNAEDPYPKFLCKTCNALLQSAILFRKTAQQSEQKLREPIKKENDNHDDTLNSLQDDSEYENIECNKPEKKPNCKKCDMSFDSFEDYNDHRMSEEHENMRHTCPFCHKSYTSLYYKKHLTTHTKTPTFVCDVCGKNFKQQGPFTRHRLTHFYKLPFKCSLCPYRGRFTESLKMHMRSHTGEKPYQCTQCPSRFISKSNLNKHFLTHKEEHDFRCDSCGRGFYTKRNLELHYKVDHTGIKEHVCNMCGKAFGYRKQMMKHQLKVHKREKMRSGRMPLYLKVDSMKQQGQNIPIET